MIIYKIHTVFFAKIEQLDSNFLSLFSINQLYFVKQLVPEENRLIVLVTKFLKEIDRPNLLFFYYLNMMKTSWTLSSSNFWSLIKSTQSLLPNEVKMSVIFLAYFPSINFILSNNLCARKFLWACSSPCFSTNSKSIVYCIY